jgi:hypothetical protein
MKRDYTRICKSQLVWFSVIAVDKYDKYVFRSEITASDSLWQFCKHSTSSVGEREANSQRRWQLMFLKKHISSFILTI